MRGLVIGIMMFGALFGGQKPEIDEFSVDWAYSSGSGYGTDHMFEFKIDGKSIDVFHWETMTETETGLFHPFEMFEF